MYTDEQIKERAREIGGRPYHPLNYDGSKNGLQDGYILSDGYCHGHTGITIRQELMRTAMGAIIPLEYPQNSGEVMCAKSASMFTNALLLQMAKDELGICEP